MEPTCTALTFDIRRRFRAFNTDVTLVAATAVDAGCFAGIQVLMRSFEQRFSRFGTDSEVARFNTRTSENVPASRELIALLQRCRHFCQLTDGVFNPLVLRQLEAMGYECSFERLRDAERREAPQPVPAFDALLIQEYPAFVSLPLPSGLDFGGIGKGYAVDRARALVSEGAGVLIDAGGDVFACGRGPDGRRWQIDVAHPLDEGTVISTVALEEQAIASSWTTRRCWRLGNHSANHLIDPGTGRSVDNGVVGVTVIANQADEADVFAKTALILGSVDGPCFLEGHGAQGLFVLNDGAWFTTPGWPGEKYSGGASR